MRSSVFSLVLAFGAIVAVQAAPVDSVFAIKKRIEAFNYDAEGNEIEKRVEAFSYDAEGNELDRREPKKKKAAAKKPAAAAAAGAGAGAAGAARNVEAFSYDSEEGNEIEARTEPFEYDAEGNEVEKRTDTSS